MPHAVQPACTDHGGAGLQADAAALADGPLREVLRAAMAHLSQAEETTGSLRPPAMCHALTEAARALAGLQAWGPAESYLAQALRWARMMGGVDQHADLACALAEVAANAADQAGSQGQPARSRAARDRARDHAFEAAGLAALTADPDWELRVLLRASDVLDRCGDHDDALQLQHRALVLMGLRNSGLPPAPPGAGRETETLTQTTPAALM